MDCDFVFNVQASTARRSQAKHVSKSDSTVREQDPIEAAWKKAQHEMDEYKALRHQLHDAEPANGGRAAVQDDVKHHDQLSGLAAGLPVDAAAEEKRLLHNRLTKFYSHWAPAKLQNVEQAVGLY